MKDLYKKMMNKDDDSDNSMKKDAKLSVLKELREMASGMMGDDVKNGMESMKKVTVAAPSTEALKEGLQKAEEVVEEMPSDMMEDADLDEDLDNCTPEELDAKIAELEAAKARMEKQ